MKTIFSYRATIVCAENIVNYKFNDNYDLVIDHHLFHFIKRNHWSTIIECLKC